MIRIYSMEACPDCVSVKEQVKGAEGFQIVDIGETTGNLKEFLKLRDTNPVFEPVRRDGRIGIPCFVKEDGTVTLQPEEVGLRRREQTPMPLACSLDGKGC